MTPSYSICVLTYNHPELLEARLTEFEAHLPKASVQICVLDNGGQRGGAHLVCARHIGDGFPISCEWEPANLGFGPGFNRLVGLSGGERLVIFSDDVSVLGDFIKPLDRLFDEHPGDAIFCQRVISFGAGWNQFGGETIAYPEGYFLAMPRATWNRIGGFDPRYAPNDYEDVDIGMTAKSLGIPVVGEPELPIHHLGSGTLGQSPARFENTVTMRARFAEKWKLPNDPPRP